MNLTAEQLRQFDDQGYCFFPNCFSEEEIGLMRSGADDILNQHREEVWREKSGAPRTAFAAHKYHEVFRLLAHHPRLVEPLRQVFGEEVYVHQFKLNAKAAFEGDVWQWHQDYGTWARDDGMPEPRAMNIAVFLDEVFPFNGALMLVPSSHKRRHARGRPRPRDHVVSAVDARSGDRHAALPRGGAGRPARHRGADRQARLGADVPRQPGARSAPNITPYPRKIVYLTLCAVSNHITKFTRPELIAHRDFTPIEPVADDALAEYARAHRVAAE